MRGWMGSPPPDWVAHLNRALAGHAVRQLGRNVLSIVLRRALFQAGCTAQEEGLVGARGRAPRPRMPSFARPEQVVRLLAAVADQ